MKKILLALLLVVVSTTVGAQRQRTGSTYDTTILRVIDGDTVVISAPFLPAPLKPELAVRIYGVDTPEKGPRARCAVEAQRGEMATAFTKQAVSAAAQRQVIIYDWDKYGGRILGDIILNGKSLRTLLIQNGFAREYYGDAKFSWCN